jgi:hypothetical protein
MNRSVDIAITTAEVFFLTFSFSLFNRLITILFKALSHAKPEELAKPLLSLRQNISLLLLITCAGLCFLAVGVNGVLIYQGKSVQDFQLNLIRSIPSHVWMTLAIALVKSVILLLLTRFSIPILHGFMGRRD